MLRWIFRALGDIFNIRGTGMLVLCLKMADQRVLDLLKGVGWEAATDCPTLGSGAVWLLSWPLDSL